MLFSRQPHTTLAFFPLIPSLSAWFLFSLIPSLSLPKNPHNQPSLSVLSRCTGGGAVEERNGAGGVEGVEVGAGPAELEVDAAGMGAAGRGVEAAWATTWRQRGPRR
jgi:hypothetical protein